jgi:hypothetical protein
MRFLRRGIVVAIAFYTGLISGCFDGFLLSDQPGYSEPSEASSVSGIFPVANAALPVPATVRGLPDLIVEGLFRDDLAYRTRVCNRGSAPVLPFVVSAVNEGESRVEATAASRVASSIAPGDCFDLAIPCAELGVPDCTLAVTLHIRADPRDEIMESDELNNSKRVALNACEAGTCSLPKLVIERVRREPSGYTLLVCNRGGESTEAPFLQGVLWSSGVGRSLDPGECSEMQVVCSDSPSDPICDALR